MTRVLVTYMSIDDNVRPEEHLDENWAHTLHVNYPELFLPILESLKEQAQEEVEGLQRIFNEFKVPSRGKVLDLSCGIGRHSINLVKKGYRVVGYDPSAYYIEKATHWAKKELLDLRSEISFYQGDVYDVEKILSKNHENDFDAIITMFNSFGYSGEARDFQMVKDLLNLAATNCILITETENRDWRIRNFQPDVNYEFDKIEIHEKWRLNLETSVAESRSKFYEKVPRDKSLRLLLDIKMTLRLYSLHELIYIINSSGWRFIRSHGNIRALESPSYETADYITISQKV